MQINLVKAVSNLVGGAIRESHDRLAGGAVRESPKDSCVICGLSNTDRRFRFNITCGYIHKSCAQKTYETNKESTDKAERAKRGNSRGPCALCTEDVTDHDQRVTAFDETTYIHLLCVKEAHKKMS